MKARKSTRSQWWHFLDVGTGVSLLYKLQSWAEMTQTISKGTTHAHDTFKLLNFKITLHRCKQFFAYITQSYIISEILVLLTKSTYSLT